MSNRRRRQVRENDDSSEEDDDDEVDNQSDNEDNSDNRILKDGNSSADYKESQTINIQSTSRDVNNSNSNDNINSSSGRKAVKSKSEPFIPRRRVLNTESSTSIPQGPPRTKQSNPPRSDKPKGKPSSRGHFNSEDVWKHDKFEELLQEEPKKSKPSVAEAKEPHVNSNNIENAENKAISPHPLKSKRENGTDNRKQKSKDKLKQSEPSPQPTQTEQISQDDIKSTNEPISSIPITENINSQVVEPLSKQPNQVRGRKDQRKPQPSSTTSQNTHSLQSVVSKPTQISVESPISDHPQTQENHSPTSKNSDDFNPTPPSTHSPKEPYHTRKYDNGEYIKRSRDSTYSKFTRGPPPNPPYKPSPSILESTTASQEPSSSQQQPIRRSQDARSLGKPVSKPTKVIDSTAYKSNPKHIPRINSNNNGNTQYSSDVSEEQKSISSAMLKASAKEFTPPAVPIVYQADGLTPVTDPAAYSTGYTDWNREASSSPYMATIGQVDGYPTDASSLMQMSMGVDFQSGINPYVAPVYGVYDPAILYGPSDGITWYPDQNLATGALAPTDPLMETTYYSIPSEANPYSAPPRKGRKNITGTTESGYQIVTSKNGTTYFIDPQASLTSPSETTTPTGST